MILDSKFHPEWEGSVSSKFGARGTLRVQCEARDGSWGIAQRGLGGYMTDVEGKLYEDFLQVKRSHPNGARRGQEVAWRPSRRNVPGPIPIEPEKLSDWPPWVPPKGTWVPRQQTKVNEDKYDAKVDAFAHNFMQQLRRRQREKQRQEDRDCKRLVQGLDIWEGELRRRRIMAQLKGAIPGASKPLAIGQPDTPSSYASLRGSASEPMFSRR
mmetsp:Transcript_31499/g.38690  ORF Transcript_31499/g.38690 Transcript_31499/m.38690 type:complete len:212 (-) Transcript_31499:92-727(-)